TPIFGRKMISHNDGANPYSAQSSCVLKLRVVKYVVDAFGPFWAKSYQGRVNCRTTLAIKDIRCMAQDSPDKIMAQQRPVRVTRLCPETRCLRIRQCAATPLQTLPAGGTPPSGWAHPRLLADLFALDPTINRN